MNNHSVSHNYVQNQSQSSWTDDPFDLKGAFTGVANVSHEQNLSNYIDELVANYAKYTDDKYELSINDLSCYDQNELVRLYLEATDRELTECVNGDDFSIDNEYTCALLEMLKNYCTLTTERFAEVTRNNMVTYYTKTLDELLDNACNNYLHQLMNEQGYHAYKDPEHGEVIWGKF